MLEMRIWGLASLGFGGVGVLGFRAERLLVLSFLLKGCEVLLGIQLYVFGFMVGVVGWSLRYSCV